MGIQRGGGVRGFLGDDLGMKVAVSEVEETRGEAGLVVGGNRGKGRDRNYEFSCGHVEFAEPVAVQAAGNTVPG